MKTKSSLLTRIHNAPLALLAFVLLSVLSVATSISASAAQWKAEKAVELIVPSGPGGANDIMARTIQKVLQSRRLVEAPITVVNKAGGGEAVAYSYLNQHPKDGHYLSVASVNLLTNRITGSHPLSFTDVTPVALTSTEYLLFVVRSDSPVKSGKDFIVATSDVFYMETVPGIDAERLGIFGTSFGGAILSELGLAKAP